MANRLDAVTVGIEHKSPVIIGVIVRPKPRPAVVAPAGSKRRRVKRIDRRAARRAKTQMRAGNRGPNDRFTGNGELDAKRAGRRPIIRTASIAKIDDAHKAKRVQRRVVKTATAIDVADTDGDMSSMAFSFDLPPPMS